MPIHDLSIDDGPLMSSWGGKRIPFMEEGKNKAQSLPVALTSATHFCFCICVKDYKK